MAEIPTLVLESITLRPMRLDDAPALLRIHQREGVLRYFPNPSPPPIERVQRFIAGQAQRWEQDGCGNWAMVLNGQDEIIGWGGLNYLMETGETEVGYLLDKPFWGKGYATQAALASLKDGFTRLVLSEIIGLVHPENLASCRVLEKCGMTFQQRKVYFGMEMCRYTVQRDAFLSLQLTRPPARDDLAL